jgi:hypothetical protein
MKSKRIDRQTVIDRRPGRRFEQALPDVRGLSIPMRNTTTLTDFAAVGMPAQNS